MAIISTDVKILDKKGAAIRQYDILKVFHFFGRRRGLGRDKHYTYKIAGMKEIPKHGKLWYFYHTAEMKDGYYPSLEDMVHIEVVSSPLTLRDQFKCKVKSSVIKQ